MTRRIAVSVPVLIALIFAAAPAAHAGLTMKQKSTGDGDGAALNSTSRIFLDTGGAKIEFLDSANPMMPAGSYMLIRPDDDGMILVNPEKKTYSVFDLGAMMQSMSAMMGQQDQGGEAMKREFSKPLVEKLLEEDGGTMLGYSTRHYRWHTQWTMSMNLPMGMSMTVENDSVEDVWVADIALDPRIMRNFENFASGLQLPDDMRQIVAAEKDKQKGIPLKRIAVTTTTTTGGGMMAKMMERSGRGNKPVRVTTEVLELSEAKIPASTFAIPAGYTETELMSPGMKMPTLNR